jgi:hypothetical protein
MIIIEASHFTFIKLVINFVKILLKAKLRVLSGSLILIFTVLRNIVQTVRFEVFTAVAMKKAVFWEVAKRRFLQEPHSITSH